MTFHKNLLNMKKKRKPIFIVSTGAHEDEKRNHTFYNTKKTYFQFVWKMNVLHNHDRKGGGGKNEGFVLYVFKRNEFFVT